MTDRHVAADVALPVVAATVALYSFIWPLGMYTRQCCTAESAVAGLSRLATFHLCTLHLVYVVPTLYLAPLARRFNCTTSLNHCLCVVPCC